MDTTPASTVLPRALKMNRWIETWLSGCHRSQSSCPWRVSWMRTTAAHRATTADAAADAMPRRLRPRSPGGSKSTPAAPPNGRGADMSWRRPVVVVRGVVSVGPPRGLVPVVTGVLSSVLFTGGPAVGAPGPR